MQINKILFLFLGVFVLLGVVFAQSNTEDGNELAAGSKLKEHEGFKKVTDPLKNKLEGLKDKLEKFKENAKQRLEKYKEQKDKWINAKQRFPGLNIMLENQEGRAATVNYLQVLGAQVQNHFEKIQDKNNLYTEYLQQKTDEINNALAQLDDNSTKEDILNTIKEIKNIWQDSEHKRKLLIANKYVIGVEKVIPKLENVLNKLDNKLDTVEASNIDTNVDRTQYYIAQESVANLKLELTSTQEKLKSMLSDESVDVKEVNEILKTLNTDILKTKKGIVLTLTEFNKLKRDFVKEKKEDMQKNKIKDAQELNDLNDDAIIVTDDSNTESQNTDSEDNNV